MLGRRRNDDLGKIQELFEHHPLFRSDDDSCPERAVRHHDECDRHDSVPVLLQAVNDEIPLRGIGDDVLESLGAEVRFDLLERQRSYADRSVLAAALIDQLLNRRSLILDDGVQPPYFERRTDDFDVSHFRAIITSDALHVKQSMQH